MSFQTRLKEARLAKEYTQEQLANIIGVAKSTYTGYEKGNREPNMLTVSKLLDALGIDANFLWQDEVGSNYPIKVSYDEIQHIEKYRALDEHGKRTVNYILEQETVRTTQLQETTAGSDNNTAPARLINYYYRLASAGTGQILFDMPPTKKIQIPDTPKNRRADYAIGVNGDSMEPVYHDGETLLVEMTEEISVGDIGIFSVNNECFVKKLGEDKLISLNPDSPNIPLNESARCMGKVIDRL